MSGKKKIARSLNELISEGYQITEKTKVTQFLEMAKKLPPSEIDNIIKALTAMLKQTNITNTGFPSFLLEGPVISDSQFVAYKKQRENFNQRRQN